LLAALADRLTDDAVRRPARGSSPCTTTPAGTRATSTRVTAPAEPVPHLRRLRAASARLPPHRRDEGHGAVGLGSTVRTGRADRGSSSPCRGHALLRARFPDLPGVSAPAETGMAGIVVQPEIAAGTSSSSARLLAAAAADPVHIRRAVTNDQPIIRGWWQYYGAFYRSALHQLRRLRRPVSRSRRSCQRPRAFARFQTRPVPGPGALRIGRTRP
jgi:hypothetical protein